MENRMFSVLKSLGYEFINENRHIKCRDSEGNIRLVSRKYLRRCIDNPRFFRTVISNRGLYLKNKTPEQIKLIKGV